MADNSYIRTLIDVLRDNSYRYISEEYVIKENSRCILRFRNGSRLCFPIHREEISFSGFGLTYYPYARDKYLLIKNHNINDLLNKFKIEGNSLILKKIKINSPDIPEKKIIMEDFSNCRDEIEDILNMVELLNINYGVFLHYMKEFYGDEKNYPLELENVEKDVHYGTKINYSSLSLNCVYTRYLSFNVKMENESVGSTGSIGAIGPMGASGTLGYSGESGIYSLVKITSFLSPLRVKNLKAAPDDIFVVLPGRCIEGYTDFVNFSYPSEGNDHEYLFYQKDNTKVYVKTTNFERDKNILRDFSENISLYNESMKHYNDIDEGYMDYIGKVIKKYLPNKNVKSATSVA